MSRGEEGREYNRGYTDGFVAGMESIRSLVEDFQDKMEFMVYSPIEEECSRGNCDHCVTLEEEFGTTKEEEANSLEDLTEEEFEELQKSLQRALDKSKDEDK